MTDFEQLFNLGYNRDTAREEAARSAEDAAREAKRIAERNQRIRSGARRNWLSDALVTDDRGRSRVDLEHDLLYRTTPDFYLRQEEARVLEEERRERVDAEIAAVWDEAHAENAARAGMLAVAAEASVA